MRSRALRYRRLDGRPGARAVGVHVDLETTPHATVVELHAPDDVGLLGRVAGVFADNLGLFDGMADRDRIAVLLDLLGRKVRVSIEADMVASA